MCAYCIEAPEMKHYGVLLIFFFKTLESESLLPCSLLLCRSRGHERTAKSRPLYPEFRTDTSLPFLSRESENNDQGADDLKINSHARVRKKSKNEQTCVHHR